MTGPGRFLDRTGRLVELVRDLRRVERARPVTAELVVAAPASHPSHPHDHGMPQRTGRAR